MNKQFLAATLLAAASAATSAADMIGDTLTFTRAYPSVNSEWAGWNPSHMITTVTADATDQLIWATSGDILNRIDPGAASIQWSFLRLATDVDASSVFDGFTITGFSQDIVSANIVSNNSSAAIQLAVAPRQLSLGFYASVQAGTSLLLSVSVVSEPATWVLLLAGLGLSAWRHKRSAPNA